MTLAEIRKLCDKYDEEYNTGDDFILISNTFNFKSKNDKFNVGDLVAKKTYMIIDIRKCDANPNRLEYMLSDGYWYNDLEITLVNKLNN